MVDSGNGDIQKEVLLEQLRSEGISDANVLRTMHSIPRETFMPDDFHSSAYINAPFPINAGQTISQPYIVALMTQALGLEPHHKVLEIGTGSGYQTAILSQLCKTVYSIERHEILLKKAITCFEALSLTNIHTKLDNGVQGWKEAAPFDRIIITAAASTLPTHLFDQLADNGIMIVPVDNISHSHQNLLKITKYNHKIHKENLGAVQFVPLVDK